MSGKSISYKNVDWSKWPEAPSEQVFNDWVAARRSKGHPVLTQTALNRYAKHIHRLHNESITVENAMACAAENGWRAIYYDFVIGAINREMNSYAGTYARDIRQQTPQQEMDTSWADGIDVNRGDMFDE